MVLFFYGADTYRSRQKLRECIAKFRRDVDPQGYNVSQLVGGETTAQAVMSALGAAPFLARKRMVVLESPTLLKGKDDERESLAHACQAALESDVVFVIWEGDVTAKARKDDPFLTVAAKSKYAQEFAALDAAQVTAWLRQQLTAAGVELDAAGWQKVSMAIDDDLWLAACEAKKLIAFAQAKGLKRLAKVDVDNLVAGGLRDDVFGLVDAVSQGRGRDALRQLQDQLQLGSHALELVSLLLRQYRLLQQVADAQAEGLPPDAIARIYKIHPFVVKKMLPHARSLKPGQVARAYGHLLALDRELKGSSLGEDVLMSRAVMHLSRSA